MKNTQLGLLTLFAASLAIPQSCTSSQNEKEEKPNFVIIFLDDSGWSDFNPFTKTTYSTPNVDDLAEQGCCYDNFYVPQAICSASRAALMTGCYPGHNKVFGAHPPKAEGLDTSFNTLGELLQENGYKTAVFGKWHIGDQPHTRPQQRGFDESSGLMYSNDMWAFHPENPEYWGQFPLHYWRNSEIVIDSVTPEDQKHLTTWYTEDAVEFIENQKDEPFFLYVPHSMPHVPLFVSEKFEGKSGEGLYADVIMELDWSVGEIMKSLKENGVEENTMVIFTSDNGPWIYYGDHAGSTPFRAAKGTSFDGGTRSACIIKYPGEIEAGIRSDRAFCSIDILPTICELSGTSLPDYEIDGKNVWELIKGKGGVENPHEYYAFSTGNKFEAVMSADGKWKLHLPHAYRVVEVPGKGGMPGQYGREKIDFALFDMENDPYEQHNVIEEYPEVRERLMGYADGHVERYYGP